MSIRDLMKMGAHAAEAAAIRRTQAVIEFDPSGKILGANDLFLQTIGYGLAEIEGQHHAMFVDAGERASPEYQAFWPRLAAGEAIQAQFLRIGRAAGASGCRPSTRRSWIRAARSGRS
jgi:methyl-accepting chemotaxis protein